MTRGSLVTVAMAGDYGKPRPALVVQANEYDQTDSLTVLLITSAVVDAPLIRQTVVPTDQNGLRLTSQVQLDKTMSINRSKIGPAFGRLDDETMLSITRNLAALLGVA